MHEGSVIEPLEKNNNNNNNNSIVRAQTLFCEGFRLTCSAVQVGFGLLCSFVQVRVAEIILDEFPNHLLNEDNSSVLPNS